MKPPGKKETLLGYLGRGIAMLHLDARRPGVVVPAQHKDDPHLRLNLSYRYGIPDLIVDDRRVQATLSFRGRPFQCQLPWGAVFGITSQATGEGQVWPEDLPGEVMSALSQHEADQPDGGGAADAAGAPEAGAEGAGEAGGEAKAPEKRRRERKRPALVAIDGDGEQPGDAPAPRAEAAEKTILEPASPPATAPAAGGPRRGHLRLVR